MFKSNILALFILLVIFLPLFLVYRSRDLFRAYKSEVTKGLESTAAVERQFLTPDDTGHLPEPVRKYLAYTGVIGREKVINVRVVTDGEFKTDPRKDWVNVKTRQYNFFADPARIYFLKINMSGVPVVGLHSYANAGARMLIKAAGLITVADGRGREMDRSETVTVFNDMCLLAPASLIDKRIRWETVDPLTVRATFDNKGIIVSALLYFNEKGELINFVSDDRYYSSTGKNYQIVRWSTPVGEYKDFNGVKLPSHGEAVWHFPGGDYCYARLNIREVEYNCRGL
ncbi:MAG: DUF6544 family protein [Bacillota bacterium]